MTDEEIIRQREIELVEEAITLAKAKKDATKLLEHEGRMVPIYNRDSPEFLHFRYLAEAYERRKKKFEAWIKSPKNK